MTDEQDAGALRMRMGGLRHRGRGHCRCDRARAKEVIGGFYIVEAETQDAALDWASKTSAAIGMPIEVRPFWSPDRA